jgi:hypothetical protein
VAVPADRRAGVDRRRLPNEDAHPQERLPQNAAADPVVG